MQRDKIEFWGAAALTVAVVLFCSRLAVVALPARDEAAQRETLDFEKKVQVGMEVEEARRLFEEGGYRHLKWVSHYHPYFVIKPPPRAGAYQWVIWLEDRSGRIVGIRTREWKGDNIHPGDAPPDRTNPETTRWPDQLAYMQDF